MTSPCSQRMTKGSIALVLLVLVTAAAATAALDCPAGVCPPCPGGRELLSCDGCRCSCAQDSDCGASMKCLPSRISDAKVDLCYSTQCPVKACYAQEPPVASAVAGEGASYGSLPDPLQGWGGDEFPDLPAFATDDEEDDAVAGQDQVLGGGDRSGKECAASCHVKTLCAFKCSRVPTARCVVDKCKCEAKFLDENGNEPDCGLATSQGGISAEEAAKDSSPSGSDDMFNEFFGDDGDDDDVTIPTTTQKDADPAMATEKAAPAAPSRVPPAVPTLKSVGGDAGVTVASTAGATVPATEAPKPSVFHQVIVPTLLVVIVIIAVFLLWKSYGKWKLWRKEKKEQRHMKDVSTNLDQDENSRMMMTVRDDVNV